MLNVTYKEKSNKLLGYSLNQVISFCIRTNGNKDFLLITGNITQPNCLLEVPGNVETF